MSCQPCQTCTPVPCVSDDPAPVVIPCVDGEPCDDMVWAHCVVYQGADLGNIGASTNDRLDTILETINSNWNSGGQVMTLNTDSVTLSGKGINSDKLEAEVNINPDTENLLVSTDKGLLVKFTKDSLLALLELIVNTPEAQDAFCDLIHNCSNTSCGIITGLTTDLV